MVKMLELEESACFDCNPFAESLEAIMGTIFFSSRSLKIKTFYKKMNFHRVYVKGMEKSSWGLNFGYKKYRIKKNENIRYIMPAVSLSWTTWTRQEGENIWCCLVRNGPEDAH